MPKLSSCRTVTNFSTNLEATEFPGLPGQDIRWRPISYDEETGRGSYLMVWGPGTRCHPHEHQFDEEFFVVEGEMQDCDGTIYRAGDFVHYSPGSRHYLISEPGCKLIGFQGGHLIDVAKDDLEEDVL